jgi:hypothetical protein
MEDETYTSNNTDNTDFNSGFPYWLRGGIFFTVIALFIGSIKFLGVSFAVGSIVGVLFGHKKSRMLWKRLPYWLRGGLVGGGIALIYAILFYSCAYTISSYYSAFGGAIAFYMFGPAFSIDWAIRYLQPVFNYTWTWPDLYGPMPMLAIPVWFFIGALIGALSGMFLVLIAYIKSKIKKSPLS